MINYDLEKRRFILSGVAIAIITVYLIRLFALQIASDDYRKRADSNAFLKKIEFPSTMIQQNIHFQKLKKSTLQMMELDL